MFQNSDEEYNINFFIFTQQRIAGAYGNQFPAIQQKLFVEYHFKTRMLGHTIKFTTFAFLNLLLIGNICDHSTSATNKQKTSVAWTVSWSFDDKFVAVGNSNGKLCIYQTSDWKKIKTWKFGSATVSRVEWNPKYPVLAIAAFSHEAKPTIIQLYDVSKEQIIRNLPDTILGRGVSWSPAGDEVAFVGKKGRISIFTKNGQFRKTLSFSNPGSLFDIDWHPTKNWLLGVEEDIFLIDIDRDTLLATYHYGSKGKGILCCAWHPLGNFFVTGDYGHENEGGEPSYLKYWDKDGILLKRIRDSKSEYRNVKWRKDGKYLAASADVLLVLSDKGEIISKTKFDNNNLWGVEWNNKGDKILSGDQAGNIRVTDINGKILKVFTL